MHHMTRAEFARHMKVNRSTVTRWIERGRLAVDGQGLIDVRAAKRALQATESPEPHHQARIAQIAEHKAHAAQQAQGNSPPDDRENVGMRLKLAMAKQREAQAEIAAMDRDKQAGLLIERERVDFVMQDFGATVRALLENLADGLAPVVYPLTTLEETSAAISEAASDVLQQLSDTMARRADDLRDKP